MPLGHDDLQHKWCQTENPPIQKDAQIKYQFSNWGLLSLFASPIDRSKNYWRFIQIRFFSFKIFHTKFN
jgi:hypothetical protein